MATAMLESKAIPANYTVYCPGYASFLRPHISLRSRPRRRGSSQGHRGFLRRLLLQRRQTARNRPHQHQYATGLGLGRRTGIDLPSEEPGLVPSEEWSERVNHHKWYPGSTISVAIGQGAVMVNAVQLARMIAAVANGGTLDPAASFEGCHGPEAESFPSFR